MPIGVIAGKAAWMDGVDGGMWQFGDNSYPLAQTTFFAGTFFKNPVTITTTRAVLGEIKSRGPALQEGLNQRTAQLAQTLNDYFQEDEVPLKIVNFGSLFRFVFKGNMDLLFYHLLDKGVYVWEGRNLFLSTAHTESDLDMVVQAVKESVGELQASEFLPRRSGPAVASSPFELTELGQASGVPLTEAQQQLWALAQLGTDGSGAYNESVALELRGPLDLAAMRHAVGKVVQRHEALRTQIGEQGDLQHILPAVRVDVPLVDLSGQPTTCKESLAEWLEAENQACFDLTQAPLLRAHLLKLADQYHILVLTAHHIVVDGRWGLSFRNWARIIQLSGMGARVDWLRLCSSANTSIGRCATIRAPTWRPTKRIGWGSFPTTSRSWICRSTIPAPR
jgi:hypothetical protein